MGTQWITLIAIAFFSIVKCDEYKKICCDEEIGCFTNQVPFNKFPLPDCSEKLGIKMKLFTRNNDKGEAISRSVIPETWDPSKQMVFVIHGYFEHGERAWMVNIKNALLTKDDLNVVLVGWKDGATKLWYPQSASNVRTVGAEIAALVNMLNSFDQDIAPYCIGFSLGSHVCGHIGMRTKLARITALDPAGPWFELENDKVGLNPGCADYVDVIHTHGLGKLSLIGNLGSLKQMGHVDFYPNGGAWQPGCLIDMYSKDSICVHSETGYLTNCTNDPVLFSIVDVIEKLIPGSLTPMCSHMRAPDLFADTVLSGGGVCNYLTMKKCEDPHKLPSSCDEYSGEPQELGYGSIQYEGRGVYYLKTGKKAPYCVV